MKQRKKIEWSRLDNASKIFPSLANFKDTKVFRLACELYEAVEADILQQALDITLESFPLYRSVLRRGIFWYYFETSDIHPKVELEANPVCAPIYIKDRRNLLFRVFYFNNRINLEIFHALSDGTGALWFMQTLLYHYLLLRHKTAFAEKAPKLNYAASISKMMDDSFGRYYAGKDTFIPILKNIEKERRPRAYHIRGSRTDENRMKIIEGAMSVKDALEEAHKYNTTLTIYVTALFLQCIYKEMPTRMHNRPVVLTVPINLRHFFKSETARNFFSTMYIGYNFATGSNELKDIIQSVSESFRTELTEERMNSRLNHLMSLEKNPLTRAVPLPVKDYSLRMVSKLDDIGVTAAISNLGQITMPAEFVDYIRQFSIFTSARRPQIIMCTYGDRLVVSFASPFNETEIQKTFFEYLSKSGIEIEITSNL